MAVSQLQGEDWDLMVLMVSLWKGWGENSGFLSQPLKLLLPNPAGAVGAAGLGWLSCNGSVTFPVNGIWHRRRDGGVWLLIGCHKFCLNWGPAFCASKSPIPVPGWGMKSAKRNHPVGISWVGRESQGSSNSRVVLITGQQPLICTSSTCR